MSEQARHTTVRVGLPSDSAAQRERRQRRPTGAPPPLPHPITISTTAWLILAVVTVAGAFLASEQTPWLRLGDRINTWILRLIAEARTPWLTDIASVIKTAGAGWAVTVIGLSVVVLTMIFRRWRHLFVFLGSFFFLGIVTGWIYSGLSRPRPYGITIISGWGGYSAPYLLVTEFFTGAAEIGDADIDDGVIDQGLLLVRKLWDAGLAHRDIKPGNLMVRDGQLLLIDVAFVQVRPSPWRQAVDLGNMMLVLAVRTDPERVYRRALRYFTPDELSEAFAATRGVASPAQLRAFMKRDPRDLLGEFRALAPPGSRSHCSAGTSGESAWPSRCSVASPWPSSSASWRSSPRPTPGPTLRSAAPATR